MNDEGTTSESHSATRAPRESSTAAIVRLPHRARRPLNAADWRLLVGVAVAQLVTAAALRALPLSTLRRRAARWRPIVQSVVRGSDERVIWAIHAAGRRLGRVSTCLVRALVAELVIEDRDGLVLTIGVTRAASGAVGAHAWLTRGDRVLIGSTSDGYVPLVEWGHTSA